MQFQQLSAHIRPCFLYILKIFRGIVLEDLNQTPNIAQVPLVKCGYGDPGGSEKLSVVVQGQFSLRCVLVWLPR